MLQCIFPSIEHGSLVQEWRDKSQEVLHHERHRSAWGAQDSLHEEKSVSWELPDTIKDSFHLRLHPVRKSGNIKNIQRTVVDGQGTPLFLEMSKYLDTRISCVSKDASESSLDNQLLSLHWLWTLLVVDNQYWALFQNLLTDVSMEEMSLLQFLIKTERIFLDETPP